MGPPQRHHAAEQAFSSQQMILSHHLGQALGSKPVCQRTRCILGKSTGFEKIAHTFLIAKKLPEDLQALFSSKPPELIQMPFHAEGKVVGFVANLGKASCMNIVGVLIAIFSK